MEEQVLELVQKMGAAAADDAVVRALCRTACGRLDGLLADGVAPEDCGEAYPLAAAWLVRDWLSAMDGGAEITALSAGDMTVRREGGGGKLAEKAMELMGPYLRDEGFVFRGVRG